MGEAAKEEEWHGRFFAVDTEDEREDFEPDHVVTVSELTGQLPVLTREERLAMPPEEVEDYRLILMEPRKYPKPKAERRLSKRGKILVAVLGLLCAVAGGIGIIFGLTILSGRSFSFSGYWPHMICTAVFLFSSFGFFCTKGKTEQILTAIFGGSAAVLTVILLSFLHH